MTARKFFYFLIGIEIVLVAVLTVIAMRGKGSISLCRYDLINPFGYITPADQELVKALHGASMANKCPINIFTAVYFAIYALLLTVGLYLATLLRKLFAKSVANNNSTEKEPK